MTSCHAEKKGQVMPQAHLVIAYGFFIVSAGAVWHLVADGAFSSVLTLSVMVQCLAVVLLALQVISTGSASGISAKALTLDAIAISCRLSSTLWLNGYLPVDASGDYIFQAFDVCSLGILLWLLREIYVVRPHTYQAEEDCLPIMPMVVGALIVSFFLHGNMNGRVIFDILWLTSLFMSTVAVLPQLWLITRTGGSVEALTSHHIAAMAGSRMLSGIFMWHAREDITCVPWIAGFNHTSWAILGAHFLHMLLLADFAYYYVKAVIACGLNIRLQTQALDCNV